jgi:programmed cell death protein 5
MSPDDLEEIRQKRLRELMQSQLQQQTSQQVQKSIQEQQVAEQIKLILTQILEPDARQRLANIRVANPEFARQIEILLIQLYQGGQLPQKLSDEGLKKILERIRGKKKETSITRAEK